MHDSSSSDAQPGGTSRASFSCRGPSLTVLLVSILGAAILLTGCSHGAGSIAGGGRFRVGSKLGGLARTSLPGLDGKPRALGGFVGRKVLMLTFWATWCEACRLELTHLDRIQRQNPEIRVLAISINPPSPEKPVLAFVKKHKIGLTVLRDPLTRLVRLLNPGGSIPFYVMIDRRGRIVHRHQGYNSGDEVEIERRLKKLVAAGR